MFCFIAAGFSGCLWREVERKPFPLIETKAYNPIATASQAAEGRALSVDQRSSAWWDSFSDSMLSSLIEQAFRENLDIAQAQARVLQAQSLSVQARARQLPAINLGANSRLEWDKEEKFSSRTLYGGLLSWVIDFSGQLEALRLARELEQEAAEAEREATRLLLSFAVADAWYRAVEQVQQLALLREQLKNDRDLLDLVELRFQAGIVSRVDVLQQLGQLAQTETLIPFAESTLLVLENQLDVLLGQAPDGEFRTSRGVRVPVQIRLPQQGVPADLLTKRPDLRALRLAVAAADADWLAAEAARFPTVTLDGTFGGGTFGGGAAGGASGFAVDFLASLFQPLIDWGLRRAEVSRNEARYKELLFAYTNTYISALAEVESLLYQITKQQEFNSLLSRRRDILAETVAETRKRYTSGLTDYLPVLDALQELQAVERELVRQSRELVLLSIRLHVALGGGALPEFEQSYYIDEEKDG